MKEGNHQFGNLRVVAFESKVSAGNEVYFSIGQVAFEGVGSGRDERRVVLSPYSQQRWLIGTEVLLVTNIPSASSTKRLGAIFRLRGGAGR